LGQRFFVVNLNFSERTREVWRFDIGVIQSTSAKECGSDMCVTVDVSKVKNIDVNIEKMKTKKEKQLNSKKINKTGI